MDENIRDIVVAQCAIDTCLVALGRCGIKIDLPFYAKFMIELSDVSKNLTEGKIEETYQELLTYLNGINHPTYLGGLKNGS